MQAIMLAAGKGSRLGKYTKNNTKCMLEVDGITLLERAIDALLYANIHKFILVLGYKKDNVKSFIKEKGLDKKIDIEYIDNDIYDTTNNIYSLYMAKDKLASDDTILLESDLIYETDTIKKLLNCKCKNVALVAKYEQWMDGTVVTLDDENNILDFIEKKDFNYRNVDKYYKTVNIYKFSKDFSNNLYIPFLEAYIKAYGNNDYYELVLKVISKLRDSDLKGCVLKNTDWYEIDDCQDLDIATCLFAKDEDKLDLYHRRFGGYWRFENLKDYCYLVNPYYPTTAMKDKMKYYFDQLLINYPSGMNTETIACSRMFENVDSKYLMLGNGAAELINTLQYVVKGKIGQFVPTFNEYFRCFDNETEVIDLSKNDYKFDLKMTLDLLNKVDALILISPDNPSGDMFKYNDLVVILEKALKNNKTVVVDESFMDFAVNSYTLIDNDILEKYPNLIVIKSISKSYGVPGIRLGVLATSDQEKLATIKQHLPVWNINSYAEYFLQIITLYKKDYKKACQLIKEERDIFYNELIQFKQFKVYPSNANYFMIKMDIDVNKLAFTLLKKYNILIKVLNGKNGFNDGQYIRLAVKDRRDDKYLIECLKKEL